MADNVEDDKVKAFDESVKKLEEKLIEETSEWNAKIKKVTHEVRGDVKILIEVQAEAINFKQMVIDEIRKYTLAMYKDLQTIKVMKKKRFEFYSTTYQLTVKNSGDKNALIEADIAKFQYKMDILETHVSFLRDTASNLETISYAVKNRIQLLDILGLS